MNLTAIRIRFFVRLLSLPWVWISVAVATVLMLSGYDNPLAIACCWLAPLSLIGTLLFYAPKCSNLLSKTFGTLRKTNTSTNSAHFADDSREDTDHRSSQLIRDLRKRI